MVTRQQDDQRGSCADTGDVRPWGECDCLESPRFHTIDDGVSIDGPMHRSDAFSMQSVRHTQTSISAGGWFVQGVEIAWPSLSGASAHLFPVGISSACQCKRQFSMGKEWEAA
jgi:hypothetical protein